MGVDLDKGVHVDIDMDRVSSQATSGTSGFSAAEGQNRDS